LTPPLPPSPPLLLLLVPTLGWSVVECEFSLPAPAPTLALPRFDLPTANATGTAAATIINATVTMTHMRRRACPWVHPNPFPVTMLHIRSHANPILVRRGNF